MSNIRRLSPRYPHRLIGVVSIAMCVCAIASISLAIVLWRFLLWGYYWATGFWAGLVIFFTGTIGAVSTCIRTRAAVMTFLVSSVIGGLVALGMVALSAGGLDHHSDFYEGYHRNQKLSTICHGSLLGLGTLELALCVLSNGISIYYLFVEKDSVLINDKEGLKGSVKKRQNGNDLNGNRYSTRSTAPLIGSASPKSSLRNSDKRRSAKGIEPPERPKSLVTDRATLRSLRLSSKNDSRSPCARSASFSTFGHGKAPDRTSQVLQPADSGSIGEALHSRIPSESESLYAETVLFGPPLPIEEDDELPPYEPKKSNPYANIDSRPKSEQLAIHQMELRRIQSTPVRSKRRDNRASRSLYDRIPHGRRETDSSDPDHTAMIYQRPHFASIRPSSSIDFLRRNEDSSVQGRDMRDRDLTRSSDKILTNEEDLYKTRTQSLKMNRDERRLLRRQRALSAEFRVTRDNLFEYDKVYNPNENSGRRRPSWIDSGETGHFVGNRVLPTRFSLRTPVRLEGMQPAKTATAIPVTIKTLPIFSPPPKPPRTHSVTKEVLRRASLNLDDNKDLISEYEWPSPPTSLNYIPNYEEVEREHTREQTYNFNDQDKANQVRPMFNQAETTAKPITATKTNVMIHNYEPVLTQMQQMDEFKEVTLRERIKAPETCAIDLAKERPRSDIKIDYGPSIKSPSQITKSPRQESVPERVSESSVFTFNTPSVSKTSMSSSHATVSSPTMVLPTSPIFNQPDSQSKELTKQKDYVYATINKNPVNNSSDQRIETAVRTASVKEKVNQFTNKGRPDSTVEQEAALEDKVVISFVDPVHNPKIIRDRDSFRGSSGVKLGTRDLKSPGYAPADRVIQRTNSTSKDGNASSRTVVFKPASPTLIGHRGVRPKEPAQPTIVPYSAPSSTPSAITASREALPKVTKPPRLNMRSDSTTVDSGDTVTLPTSPIVTSPTSQKPIFKPATTSSTESKVTSPRSQNSASSFRSSLSNNPVYVRVLEPSAIIQAQRPTSGALSSQSVAHQLAHRQPSLDGARQTEQQNASQHARSPTEGQSPRRSGSSSEDRQPLFVQFL